MNLDPLLVLDAINSIAYTVFFVLLGMGVFSMLYRILLYRSVKRAIPAIVKRDFGLFLAAVVTTTEGAGLMLTGVELDGWLKVAYRLQVDIVFLIAIGYWVLVELTVVDDFHRE